MARWLMIVALLAISAGQAAAQDYRSRWDSYADEQRRQEQWNRDLERQRFEQQQRDALDRQRREMDEMRRQQEERMSRCNRASAVTICY